MSVRTYMDFTFYTSSDDDDVSLETTYDAHVPYEYGTCGIHTVRYIIIAKTMLKKRYLITY